MDDRTGEIKPMEEIQKMGEDEKLHWHPLTRSQHSKLMPMDPSKRLEWWRTQGKHKQKQVDKRRRLNKLKNKRK